MSIKEKYNKKLLVEGKDDQHVIWSLCEQFKLNENFDVIDCEGIDNLLDQIPIRFKQSNIETIGIIVDADTDLRSIWMKLHNIITTLGYKPPDVIDEHGYYFNEMGQISIGVWIMPNNILNGMLEDFIKFLVPEDDELLPIIESNLKEIENKHLNKYKSLHKSKATIHSWLSVQEVPGTPMGLGITKRYLTTDIETCKVFVNWLKTVFE